MTKRLQLIDAEQRAASIGMLLTFVGFCIAYPLSMLVFDRPGWMWDFPARNLAMEHMLVVNYGVLGLFFLFGARTPLRFLPLIDYTIVFNLVHATMMGIDAFQYPHHQAHLRFGGDVPATYLVAIILMITHPKRCYVFQKSE